MALKVRGITIDIGADTTGLNKALTATNKEIKSTQSQLKDVEKLLKLDPKNVELLAQKQKLLAKATEETKSKISTLKDALQKMKDQGVDEASDAFQAMQRELIATEQELKKYTSQTKESTKETKKSAEGYTTAKEVLAQLAVEGIKTALNALKELGKELVAQIGETAEYGDNIDKMSQKIGISAEEYQKLGYAFERSGANIDSLQGGMKTLNGVLVDAANGSEQAQAKLAAIGLTAEDLAGKSSDAQLNMVINALQGMEEGAERTAAATDLLGKSATELGPLLNMSAEDLEALKKEAEDYGMVMSDEAVKQSAEFEDSMTRLEGTVTGLRNRLVGQLLPGITKVTDGLAKMMSGQEGGTDDIAEGIGEFLEQIITLLPQFNAILVDVVKKLLELIVQNLPMIIDTLFTLVDQVLETVLDLLPDLVPKLIDGIALLISRILEHLPEIIGEIVKALPEIISGLIQALINNLPLLVNGLITFVGALVEELPEIMKALFEGIINGFQLTGEQLKELGKSILNGLIWVLNKAIDGINLLLTPLRAIILAVGNMFGAKWSMNNVAIPHIPMLAKGGILSQGSAIVGERGPELLSVVGGRAVVQPLTNNYNSNLGGVNITINTQPGQSATDIADAVSIALAEQYARTKAVYV